MGKQPKPLKIGIICEGQRDGAEQRVFRRLVSMICPRAVADIVPSTNRPNLFRNAPTIANQLFSRGCVAIFIVWDTHPAFSDSGGTTDCKVHRKTVVDNLTNAGVNMKAIITVAIHEMLDAWLLCDGNALSAAMRRGPHIPDVGHEKRPDRVNNPKAALARIYRNHKLGTYDPTIHAGQIISFLVDTMRLRRSQSFSRFEDRLSALCNREQ